MYGNADVVIKRTGADAETLGFDSESDLEEFVGDRLAEASDSINRYTNRTFELHEDEQSFIRVNRSTREIRVPKRPLVEIHELKSTSKTLSESDYRIKDDSMLPDLNAGIIERTDHRTRFRPGVEYAVSYDWGFEDVPGVVDSVANELAIDSLNEMEAEIKAGGTSNISMDGYSVTYDVANAAEKGTITDQQLSRLDNLSVFLTA